MDTYICIPTYQFALIIIQAWNSDIMFITIIDFIKIINFEFQ